MAEPVQALPDFHVNHRVTGAGSDLYSKQKYLYGHTRLLRAFSSQIQNVSEVGECKITLGSLTVLMEKKVFSSVQVQPPVFQLNIIALILPPCTSVKSLAPSY